MAEKKTNSKNSKTSAQTKKPIKSKKASSQKKENTKQAAKELLHKDKEMHRQKLAIILLCLGALTLSLCVIPGQSVWSFLRTHVIFGVFGVSAFLIPIFMFCMVAFCVKDKNYDKSMTGLIASLSTLVLIVSALIHIIGRNAEFLSDESIWDQIKLSFSMGPDITNGGLFGAVIGGILTRLFGKTAALVTMVIVCFALIMFITNTTLVRLKDIMAVPVKKVGEVTEERIERFKEMKREQYDEAAFINENDFLSDADFEPENILPPEIEDEEADFEDLKIIPPPRIYAGNVREAKKKENIIKPLDFDLIGDNNFRIQNETIAHSQPPKKAAPTKTPIPVKEKQTQKVTAENTFMATETAYISKRSGGTQLYKFPPIDCLSLPNISGKSNYEYEQKANGQKLVDTLRSFGIETKICEICRGPSVTRYEIQPAPGVKISRILGLSDDIAMNMAASGVRIEAPIPNKSAIGIEIPNRDREMVTLRELIDTDIYRSAKSKLNVALGRDITGNIICADLSKMPHLLIAGTTGSGKSVCLNSMIISLLYNATPDEVKLLMIDPKQVEFTVYNGIPHLLVPVVCDPRKSAGALAWAVTEMLNRYKLFAERNVRDIKGYNKLCEANTEIKKMPHIVIFIDELSDLMMAAPNEVQDSICRLAQMARAAGMHLVIATQRPSVNVITGVIKANIPSRISLSVSSQIDSRTIIDTVGAEKLLGNGDMLFSPVGMVKPLRLQGSFLSDSEVEDVVNFIKNQKDEAGYDEDIIEEIEKHAITEKKKAGFEVDDEADEADVVLPDAIKVVVEAGMASTTLLQKRLKLGYARASRIIDDLETRGIIGPFEGSKPRKVLITKQQYNEMNALSSDGTFDLSKSIPLDNDEDEEDF